MSAYYAPIRLSRPYLADGAGTIELNPDGSWEPGEHTAQLEAAIARSLEVHPGCVVCTRSCTAAIHAAAKFWERSTGELLSAPCLTYPGTYRWRRSVRLSDCGEDGWPVNSTGVAVDLWGRSTTEEEGVILDAAHNFLGPGHARSLTWGRFEFICYSFAPQKQLPGFMGGALVCRQSSVAAELRRYMRNHRDDTNFGLDGTRELLPDPVAAFLLKQIKGYDEAQAKRKLVLRFYDENLENSGIQLMTRPGYSSGHLAVVKFKYEFQKRQAADWLRANNIESGVHYNVNPSFLEAKALVDRLLSLPCHTFLSATDLARICDGLLAATKGRR